jgi:transposase
MSVHPPELRWRVVSAYEGGEGSYEELAERFVVARSTVQEWMDLYRATGGLEAQNCGRKTNPGEEALWREQLTTLLNERNDLTLSELVELLRQRYGKQSSTSGVDRWLNRLNLTRKKRRSGQVNKIVNESGV